MAPIALPSRHNEHVAKATASGKSSGQVHPLSPLSSAEIEDAATLIKEARKGTVLAFKQIVLQEPAKDEMFPYLVAENEGSALHNIDRRAFLTYYEQRTNRFHEAVVNLSTQKVEKNFLLGPNQHGNADGPEIMAVEKCVMEDEKVSAEIAKLNLPKGTIVVCDPWIYGSDGINDDDRIWQCFLYIRDPNNSSFVDSNHYAFPLAVSPVVDSVEMKVIRVDILPTGADHTIKELGPYTAPAPNEYVPESLKLRDDLKPLNVVQPEGASFTATKTGEVGELIEWQKWSFRVGFNAREGMVIYNVKYDGRPLFYRLSLSDMSIPYADPRHPFHKKSAFDLGDAGAGLMANNLKLGCDCLGSIHYMDAILPTPEGKAEKMPNVVCVHEQDNGIGWKHSNYRTGRAAIVRNRELAVQSIITVANYEYIMAFIFNQAGAVEYEVRATGILSTQPIDEGLEVPWGTVVHPGVLAVHHQHIFSLRVDPMLDGSRENQFLYEEVFPMPRTARSADGKYSLNGHAAPTTGPSAKKPYTNLSATNPPNIENPHGVGFYSASTHVTQSCGLDANFDTNRIFKIQHPSSKNPINGRPLSYKIHAPPFQKMLADASSYHHKRAEFADKNIYVVKYRDDELYAAGKYTNQSRGGSGVRTWAARNDDISNADIVVYIQFGLQHIPRIEDFPVMPVEILRVGLKPSNFFERNPALDVPPSVQELNRSVLVQASEPHHAGVEGKVNGNGTCCEAK